MRSEHTAQLDRPLQRDRLAAQDVVPAPTHRIKRAADLSPHGDRHEHLACPAGERDHARPRIDRNITAVAAKRRCAADAQAEQLGASARACAFRGRAASRPSAARSIAWRQSQSTGRRLSGSTSARNGSSSPW